MIYFIAICRTETFFKGAKTSNHLHSLQSSLLAARLTVVRNGKDNKNVAVTYKAATYDQPIQYRFAARFRNPSFNSQKYTLLRQKIQQPRIIRADALGF